MSTETILSNVAMLSLFLGTLPSIRAVLKSRSALDGFSLIGAIGLFAGQTMYLIYFILLPDLVTAILTIPLVSFWGLVILFKVFGKSESVLTELGDYEDD